MQGQKLQEFLNRYRLHADSCDLDSCVKAFMQEMEDGLCQKGSSLQMIPTFLSPETKTVEDQTVIVLDAGGTNLRVGCVGFRDGVAQDVEFEKFPLPGTEQELSCDAFFDAIAEKLSPYLDRSKKIGFCFSYAARCKENKDAEIVHLGKEVKVVGAAGREICRSLTDAIRRRGVKTAYSCVQLNDTVATLLGGMAASDRDAYDGYIGFILGTGINGCYTENTENIKKYEGGTYTAKTMIINTEAGGYKGFLRGTLDEQLDAASAIPGHQQMEKMVSGAYLGKIIAAALKQAAREGLMGASVTEDEVPMPQVNAFLAGEASVLDCVKEDDRAFVRDLILAIYSRVARFMAVVFTAIALHTGKGREKPMAIVLEGSTYQKSPELQRLLDAELNFVKKTYGCGFKVIGAENATLIGSAFAAVSNI